MNESAQKDSHPHDVDRPTSREKPYFMNERMDVSHSCIERHRQRGRERGKPQSVNKKADMAMDGHRWM